jgi:hypothetical protein
MTTTALETTAVFSPDDRSRQIGEICERATEAQLNASGAFSTAANSRGVRADLVMVVMSDDSAGYAAGRAWRLEDLGMPAQRSSDLQVAALSSERRGAAPTFQPRSQPVHDLRSGA